MPFKRLLSVLLLACGVLALAGAGAAVAAPAGNPLAAGPWFVDWHWKPAVREVSYQRSLGHLGTANQLDVLARTPSAKWWPWQFGEQPTRAYFDRAVAEEGADVIPTLVTENLPGMGCAQNGGPSAAGFRRWVDGFARGIGRHRAVIFVESDGIGSSNCLRGSALNFRLGLIAYEVRRLAALPNTGVYIDAGASDWLSARRAAQLLRRVGVGRARGFVLDPTHYEWTHTQIAYGTKISRLLGGKHFVVNTAMNGNGPLVPRDRVRYGNEVWCNPAGRALGALPTLGTGNRLVDAFFWVSPPGLSDGPCANAPGSMPGPRTGAWWLQWALELTGNAAHARDFPRYRG